MPCLVLISTTFFRFFTDLINIIWSDTAEACDATTADLLESIYRAYRHILSNDTSCRMIVGMYSKLGQDAFIMMSSFDIY